MPSPGSDQPEPPRADSSPAPERLSADAGGPRAPRPLESCFSVEAILARPEPRAPAASGIWTAPSPPPAPALPWACPAALLLASRSLGLYRPVPEPPARGLRGAHLCGLRGLGVTVETEARDQDSLRTTPGARLPAGAELGEGLELAHCPGLWSPPDWALAKDLQDTERPQKRVRTMFNLEQLEELEKVFAKQHNLVGKDRAQLAARLSLTENQVRVWFQNRRVKYQKQQRLRPPAVSAMAASPDEPSSSSDTIIQRENAGSGVDS